jgi:hypothetical protein
MITAQRQEILQILERLSELTTDVRFGQLIANLSYLAIGPTNEAIWDMEDEQLVVALRKHIADLSLRVVTDDNMHGEWDTGTAVGKEVW